MVQSNQVPRSACTWSRPECRQDGAGALSSPDIDARTLGLPLPVRSARQSRVARTMHARSVSRRTLFPSPRSNNLHAAAHPQSLPPATPQDANNICAHVAGFQVQVQMSCQKTLSRAQETTPAAIPRRMRLCHSQARSSDAGLAAAPRRNRLRLAARDVRLPFAG